MSRSSGRFVHGAAFLLFATAVAPGCDRFERKHVPVAHVAERGYPTCPGAEKAGLGGLLGGGHLRPGPNYPDRAIVERFEIRQRACLTVMTVRQEWPLGTADVEVVYDAAGVPLRIWKRMTLPGLPDPIAGADIRRYELRDDPVTMKRRSQKGHVDFERLVGGRPRVVIGPGRGLLSMWIRRAQLEVGQKTRELAIDIRGLEKIEPVTLLRERDMDDPALGGHVRVYTFYGRETVFTDAQGMVTGDLMGLRSHRLLKTPAPPAIPLFAPLDPVGTP